MAYLVMVDRCYRGGVEAQFYDPVYGILGLRAQFGDVDVVLRGNAVTVAVSAPPPAGGWPGLPDPRDGVRALLAEGMTVYADEPSLRGYGLSAGSLLPGVTAVDTTELAGRWAEYDGVWFL